MFVIRLLLFLVGGAAGYVATVAAAFGLWSWIGVSGPDYTPLLIVLFIIAPIVAAAAGAFAASFPRRRRAAESEAPERKLRPRKRYGPLEIGVMLSCALIIAIAIAALRAPQVPH